MESIRQGSEVKHVQNHQPEHIMEGLGIPISFSLECLHFKRTLKNPNLPDLAADVKIQEAPGPVDSPIH